MKWIRIALGLQILFFLGWVALEEYRMFRPQTVLLETRPVDPRDLWAGQYMVLRYSIESQTKGTSAPIGEVAVKLTATATALIGDAQHAVWAASELIAPAPDELPAPGKHAIWVRGKMDVRGRVTYGIERYYFSERRTEALGALTGGDFWVSVDVGRDGVMRVKDFLW